MRISARIIMMMSLIALGSASCASSPRAADIPSFTRGACPFVIGSGLVEGHDVTCGILTVRANRAQPESATLHLAVSIFKSQVTSPAADPVIMLSGGPGESPLLDFVPFITVQNARYLVGDRDLILLDPRGGAGYSRPSLDCPELRDALYGAQSQSESVSQDVALQQDALAHCHARLSSSGVNFNVFTSAALAADVRDLIGTLGYKEVNLLGGSYGTRWALEIMRTFPQHIRSVVLDSAYPPQANLFTDIPASATQGFDLLFANVHLNQLAKASIRN